MAPEVELTATANDWFQLALTHEGRTCSGWHADDHSSLPGLEVGEELYVCWSNPLNFRTAPAADAPRLADRPTVPPGAGCCCWNAGATGCG
ncbi:MAG: hypothetical protein GF399_03490 [Candidatus Coatesbacteria bacterium]|nr:hypothetical protein [Candidatus Coatesbacteria bacterium]